MRFDPSIIPARMQSLPRDKRGYPIPFIVFRDDNGDPHFTINDSNVVLAALTGSRCSICGGKLGENIWMIGGPKSAFHEHGAYIDPPVHKDCGTFALKTCPYIALPSYSKRIDAKTIKPGSVSEHLMLEDRTMIPDRPPVFVFAKTSRIQISAPYPGAHYVHPKRPWREVEYWQDGKRITPEAAMVIMAKTEDFSALPYWPDQPVARRVFGLT